MTRPIITTLLLVALTLSIGCNRKEVGPAYGHKQEFQQQISNSIPVKEWGYSITDIRLSDDAQKVLVIFASSRGTNYTEIVMTNDSFRRYTGTFYCTERHTAALKAYESESAAWTSNLLASGRIGLDSVKRPPFPMSAGSAWIVVTLPDR